MWVYMNFVDFVFQSSPQILITTAFIIRAATTKPPIVYISLFSSLWSICDRVAADDKHIFEKQWRDMILDDMGI